MLADGIIQPSASPWSAPVVMVPKKDGKLRFCIDYRKLNAVTKRDQYPLPRIDDLLNATENAKYYTALDITWGYWNLGIAEHDCPRLLLQHIRAYMSLSVCLLASPMPQPHFRG